MGRSIATEFSGEGAACVLSGRNAERGTSLADELTGKGGKAIFLAGDVGLEEINKRLVETALQNFGKLDGVITNAGMLGLGKVTDLESDVWQETFQTNVYSVFYLLKHAIPEMQKNGSGRVIVNASIAAFKSFPNHPAYCASKAAAVSLAKQIASDYGPEIRVNAICPGPVDTPFLHDSAIAFPDPEKAVAEAGEKTLLKRLGKPDDIAKLVAFLAGDESSWITGSSYIIDGGTLTAG